MSDTIPSKGEKPKDTSYIERNGMEYGRKE